MIMSTADIDHAKFTKAVFCECCSIEIKFTALLKTNNQVCTANAVEIRLAERQYFFAIFKLSKKLLLHQKLLYSINDNSQ